MDKNITVAKQLAKDERRTFYQSKYDYYKGFNKVLMIVATMAYFSFFITDCGIFGRFAYESVVSRAIMIIPLAIFLYMYKRVKEYKTMVIVTYILIHAIIWCTDWSTYLLPDRGHAGEGMIVMNLIFVCAGFCAPYKYAIIAHSALVLDIVVANLFIKYDDVTMMLMFNIPCIIGICIMHYYMERTYLDHYLINEKLEKLVVHDQLTGVYNRNKFRTISDADTEEFVICEDAPLSVIMLDLDYFKKINDKYGHEAGDIVLKHTASVLNKSVRSSDFVIRWGGEEFVVILVGCDVNRAVQIAEKIRVNIESSENSICPVTASIGVAEYVGGSYHDVIECADVALYKAKKNGRNQVVQYQDE